jgi:hypothetical protein
LRIAMPGVAIMTFLRSAPSKLQRGMHTCAAATRIVEVATKCDSNLNHAASQNREHHKTDTHR